MDDGPGKTMLGRQQLLDLEVWLATAPGWRVVVSGVPFTSNWQTSDFQDSWGGYMFERQKILESMWKTEGVLIISGVRLPMNRFSCSTKLSSS